MKRIVLFIALSISYLIGYSQVNCLGTAPSTINLTDKVGICNGNLQRTATVSQLIAAGIDTTKVGRIEQGRGSTPFLLHFNGTAWVKNDTSYAPKSALLAYIPLAGSPNISGSLYFNNSGQYIGRSGLSTIRFNDTQIYANVEDANNQAYVTPSVNGINTNVTLFAADKNDVTKNRGIDFKTGGNININGDIAKYTGLTNTQVATKLNAEPFGLITKYLADSLYAGGGTLTSVYSANSDILVDSSITGKRKLTLNKTLTSGYINIGDGTNTAFPRTLSGDVTINNLGEATVDSINGITKSYYDPRSSIQDQLDEKQDKLSNYYIVSTVSALQTYLSGLGSGVDVNIWFPFGTYNVTTPITISNKGIVNIKSEGATLTNSLSATGSVIAITTVTTCDIENLNIDMNLNTQTSAGITLNGLTGTSSFTRLNMYSFYDMDNKGLVLQDVSPGAPSNAGTVITDCNFYNIPLAGTFDYNNNTAKGIGVYMPSGAEYWKMDNCTFSALHVGVWLLNGANGLVNNCDFLNCNPYLSGTKYAALYIQDNASNIGKLTVTGCKFNHNWGYSFFSTTTTLSYPPIVITGCEFISNAISAMRMGPALTGAEVTANMFRTANLQSTALNSPYTDADCDYILLQSSKNIIQSNYFWKQSTYHYAVTSIGSADSNVVKNNYIDPTMGTVTMVGSANIVQLNGREGDFIKQGGNIQARFTNSLTGIGGLNVGGVDTTLQMMLGNIGHNNTNYIAKSKNTAGITFSYATNTPVITSYLNTGQTINGTATFTTQSRQWIGGNFSFGSGVNVLGTTQTNTMFLKTGTSSTSGQSGHFSMNSATINGSDDCPHFWTADNMNVYLGKRFGMKSANDLNLATNNTVRMSIDSLTGHVGIGVVNPSAKFQVSLSGQALSSSVLPSSVVQTVDIYGNKILSIRNIVSNDSASRRGLFSMAATGGTNNAMTAVANGRFLGSLIYSGHDGTSFVDGASISAIVNGTVSTGNLPTDIILNTTVSNVALERMRVTSTGNVGIGTSSPTSTLNVSGSFALAYVAKTGTYTATANDYLVDCTSGTFTVTLPTAVGITGRIYEIVNSGAGTITVATTSSQTFVNVTATPTTLSLITALAKSVRVMSNGANWIQLN